MKRYSELSASEKAETIALIYGFFQDVESKQNQFAGKITMDSVIAVFDIENPTVENDGKNWSVSLDYFQKIRSACYQTVRPVIKMEKLR